MLQISYIISATLKVYLPSKPFVIEPIKLIVSGASNSNKYLLAKFHAQISFELLLSSFNEKFILELLLLDNLNDFDIDVVTKRITGQYKTKKDCQLAIDNYKEV